MDAIRKNCKAAAKIKEWRRGNHADVLNVLIAWIFCLQAYAAERPTVLPLTSQPALSSGETIAIQMLGTPRGGKEERQVTSPRWRLECPNASKQAK